MTLRSTQLRKLFNRVLHGEQVVETANNAKLFLEATSNEPDSASCLQRLMSKPEGFASLQVALRIEYSYSFLNGPLAGLLIYLQVQRQKVNLSLPSKTATTHQSLHQKRNGSVRNESMPPQTMRLILL